MDIKADEISKIIREQIGSYAVDVDVAEVGSIISIGDGIARVHGVENLYVASSSVFPTGGQANPTLLATALAIRMAEHLSGIVQRERAT